MMGIYKDPQQRPGQKWELTLGAGGSFPALLADAGESVPTDHTGAAIFTRAGHAAAVPGCQTQQADC